MRDAGDIPLPSRKELRTSYVIHHPPIVPGSGVIFSVGLDQMWPYCLFVS